MNIQNIANFEALQKLLDSKVLQFNQPDFIKDDPISIPHLFSKKEDIEIMGFWAAVLAWGQRVTIINKCKELITLMDNAPHDFIINHQDNDLKKILHFKHRTFNSTDTLYFIHFFKQFYTHHQSLEEAFTRGLKPTDLHIENGLNVFFATFFESDIAPERTKKHIASPARKSACKRINMYLRWMVRTDDKGVDFGIWKTIKPNQLICPCDVHVDRVARKLGLIQRPQTDWLTAVELTKNLQQFDPNDPVKYDFALFGMGVEKYF
jgi:uncharacterized protein (TIGR02757 family)